MDTIVVGGGIAGLLTALRLARAGQRVLLIEADRLGAGATCANHGMLHSGALYLRQHGHVIRHCREAQAAFTTLVGEAELSARQAAYIVPTADDAAFRRGLDLHDIPHERLRPGELPDLRPGVVDTHTLVGVGERVFSSRRIVEILAGQCLAAGVSILVGTTVSRITRDRRRVTGVMIGVAERLPARHVVIAAGLGTTELLTDAGSRLPKQLRSRLDMMIYFPRAELQRGLVFTELHRPVLMPAPGGVLASFFGGVQPQIEGRRAFGVDIAKAAMLTRAIEQTLQPRSVNRDDAVAYVAGKTDYVGTTDAEAGMINPGFQVIDHSSDCSLAGLYTIITGKMTLGFHASKAAATMILKTDQDLRVAPGAAVPVPRSLLSVEPWSDPALL